MNEIELARLILCGTDKERGAAARRLVQEVRHVHVDRNDPNGGRVDRAGSSDLPTGQGDSPVTPDEIDAKIDELMDRVAELRTEIANIREEIDGLLKQLEAYDGL